MSTFKMNHNKPQVFLQKNNQAQSKKTLDWTPAQPPKNANNPHTWFKQHKPSHTEMRQFKALCAQLAKTELLEKKKPTLDSSSAFDVTPTETFRM